MCPERLAAVEEDVSRRAGPLPLAARTRRPYFNGCANVPRPERGLSLTELAVVPPSHLISDPDNVPVRVADRVAFCGIVHGAVSLILSTNRGRFDAEGKIENDHVIAARIRLDTETARLLRDALTVQLALLAHPEGRAN